jgi:sialate O-acetylesterase
VNNQTHRRADAHDHQPSREPDPIAGHANTTLRRLLPGWIRRAGLALAIATAWPAPAAAAEDGKLWMPAIFADGMVLQRQMKVPVWGGGEEGENIAVEFNGQSKSAVVKDGKWRVDLEPMQANSTPQTMTVKGKNTLQVRNVLVGEVWIVCGQSNAGFQVNASAEREDAETNRSAHPLIRVAAAGRFNPHTITEPQDEVGNGGPVAWRDTARNVGQCSAVGYYFARDLARWMDGKVPVGVIELIAILPVQSWVDEAVLEKVPELASLKGKPYPSATGRAYKANIAPLAPYAVRGAVYYQGEMNGAGCVTYYHGLKAMMTSWRGAWGNPGMPFLLVQLPGFLVHQKGKTDMDMNAKSLAEAAGKNRSHPFIGLREAAARVKDEDPRVGLAVTIDVGEKLDIHPPRKRPVGERLALQARKLVYGDQTVVADGPVAREFRREGAGFVIGFDGVGGGLAARGGLDGFEVRAADGTWHGATAVIRGTTVGVRAEKVKEPTGVRYAWAGFPEATLHNKEGLPARPFRHPATALEVIQKEGQPGKLTARTTTNKSNKSQP